MDAQFLPKGKFVAKILDDQKVDCRAIVQNMRGSLGDALITDSMMVVRYQAMDPSSKPEVREDWIPLANVAYIKFLDPANSPFAAEFKKHEKIEKIVAKGTDKPKV